MQYLCFVNGRNQEEIVKIIEGESYEIDRLTCNCVDSEQIRKKYKKQFAEFQSRYPQAKNGAVRIYGDNVYNENGQRVLYKKHKVAFNHIIKDTHFLRWFSRKELQKEKKDRIIFDTYILRGISEFNLEIVRINQFLSSIKRDDKKDSGLTGGGKRYYRFMRALLNAYEEYRQIYKKSSIDKIWKEHLARLEKTKLEKEPLGENIILPEEPQETLEAVEEFSGIELPSIDLDEDSYRIYDEEPLVFEEPLYEFFTGDHFERYYSDVFADESLMLVGDFPLTRDAKKIEPWSDVATTCYNGTTFVGCLEQFDMQDVQTFNASSIIIIYGEEDTRYLRTAIVNAIQNKAEVVLISDNPSLLELYAKKFKNIVPIFDNEQDKHLSAKRQLVDFFISQYNAAKGYRK